MVGRPNLHHPHLPAAIRAIGGRVLHTFPGGRVPFIPDDFWRGDAKKRTVGNIETGMMVAVVTTAAADVAHPMDVGAFNSRIAAWSRAVNLKLDTDEDVARVPPPLRVWELSPPPPPLNRDCYLGAATDDRHPEEAPAAAAAAWPRRLGALGVFPPSFITLLVDRGATRS